MKHSPKRTQLWCCNADKSATHPQVTIGIRHTEMGAKGSREGNSLVRRTQTKPLLAFLPRRVESLMTEKSRRGEAQAEHCLMPPSHYAVRLVRVNPSASLLKARGAVIDKIRQQSPGS